MLNADAAGRSAANLNTAELTNVESIALANNRYVSRLAKNLLEEFYGYTFGGNLAPESAERSQPDARETSQNAGISPLRVYPNPADQEITFEWMTGQPDKDAVLTISDAYGQYSHTFVINSPVLRIQPPAERMRPGLYYYTLKNKNAVLQNGKFIVR